MPNITNVLNAIITSTDDASGAVPINFGTGNPSFDCTTIQYDRYLILTGGVQNFGVPKSPATIVYMKNLDGAKTVALSWTPNGGANAAVVVLNPGDQIILFANPAGGTTPGITALQVQSSAAGCPIEFVLAG